METLWQDLRYSARSLRSAPGFAAAAILTLALGIGSCTAMFSILDAVLLRPLPYPNPDTIVRIWEQNRRGHRIQLADPNFNDFRAQNNTLQDMAVYAYELSAISGGSEPVRANVAAVSKGFFRILGVEPFRGRTFVAEEQREHGAPAAIVSFGYWQRYLGGRTDLSQFHLHLAGAAYSVVGVMPEGFDFPSGAAVWIPREVYPELPSRTAHNWQCIGRVRDGFTVTQARANLSAIAKRIKAQYGKEADLTDAAVAPLGDAMVGDVRTALLTLFGSVGLLLLVACANVAGLLVARTSTRRKELAVRSTLGAGRGRLIQQFLVESFSISIVAGLLGIALTAWTVKILPAILPTNLPRQQGIEMNTPVLLFALAGISAVAVSLGLVAAWRATSGNLQEALASGARGYSATHSSQRLRGFVVTGEIAATLVILIGAGLLGRSFLRLIHTNPGFRPEHLLTIEFSLPEQGLANFESANLRQVHLLQEIVARLRAIPGVDDVGLTGAMPVAGGDDLSDGTFLILNGRKPPSDFVEFEHMALNSSQTGHALYCVGGEDYFRTMGIPVIHGRLFSERDGWNSPHVALISEALARQRWPNEDPIGQVIEFGNMDGNLKPLTIVGVVGDVRASGLDSPPSPIIYVDYAQRGMSFNASPTILLRSTRPEGAIVTAARGIFHDLAPDTPVKFSTFADEMGGWLAERRFLLLLVTSFAMAALALAAIGIYGVIAFSVTRRTQEIGVRMALGAQRRDVLNLVVGEGARLAVLGVAIGIALSLLVTRVLSSLLYGVSASDPITFAGVAILLCFVALLASYIPARRAVKLDPNVALRYE